MIYVEGCSTQTIYGSLEDCEVAVVDGRQEKLAKTIPIPDYGQSNPSWGTMALDPLTGKVYIDDQNGLLLVVIECEETGEVRSFSVLQTEWDVAGIAVSPYVHRLYVSYTYTDDPGTDFFSEELGFFDTRTEKIALSTTVATNTNMICGGGCLTGLWSPAVDWTTGHIFGGITPMPDYEGAGSSPPYLMVLDSRGNILASVEINALDPDINYPFGPIVVDPKTKLVFVPTADDITVVDASTNTYKTSILGYGANYGGQVYGGIAVDPDTSRLYVADGSGVDVFSEQ